jgi:membrane protein YdbS with pleckstrin-like domain
MPSSEIPGPTGIADGLEKSLDPRSITADRWRSAITVAVFAGATFVGAVVLIFAGPLDGRGSLGPIRPLLSLLGWFLLSGSLAATAFFWPRVRYRHTSYRLSERGIRIRRGVLWRLAISVPRSRVQHTDVSRGPIERALDLATLVVYTAGTQHASVHLSGLTHETALAIRDFLIDGGDDDAV